MGKSSYHTLYIYFTAIFLLANASLAQAQKNRWQEELQLGQEYYFKGEIEKAISLFDDLAKHRQNINIIHNNYFDALIKANEYKKAQKYLRQVQNWFPRNPQYFIDEGILQQMMGSTEHAESIFNSVVENVGKGLFNPSSTAQYFINKNLLNYGLQIYLVARKRSGQSTLYTLELANTYRLLGNKDAMVREYLNYIDANPRNINYVKNILQSLLTDDDDLQSFEYALYDRVQRDPENLLNNELLIWTKLQMNDFAGALTQAMALDRKQLTPGEETMEIGDIAMRNSDYVTAIRAYQHISNNYTQGYQYERAKRQLIKAQELKITSSYPVSQSEILSLIQAYEELIAELGKNRTTLEALRNKALLHAHYLGEFDVAAHIFQEIINDPRSGQLLIAQAKLNLGDIYLLKNEPWESTLLYSQVEKENKETPIAYEAKLRNAKLNYYTGNFNLASGHLDILKDATSREIANDALELNILIKNNTVFDEEDSVLQSFAAVDLLMFQNQMDSALQQLEVMRNAYSGHSLEDEVLFRMADISRKKGEIQKTINYLEIISTQFSDDILGDDAYFLLGVIYQDELHETEKAMTIFQDFLVTYPGSLYVAEARKRFRMLRGDML
jgi:tetratricopeptide (TPR) repeat protein